MLQDTEHCPGFFKISTSHRHIRRFLQLSNKFLIIFATYLKYFDTC